MNISELKDFQVQRAIRIIEESYNQTIAEKFVALALHLDLTLRELLVDNELEVDNDDITFTYGRNEYKVMTDDEAEDAWDENLDSYIDECILPEIPIAYQYYFDDEKWKRDAKYDPRGSALAGYDGNENEEKVNGSWYYIYRTN
jgi:hypothetical protein